MIKKKLFLIILVTINSLAINITNYHPIFSCFQNSDNSTQIAIREFKYKNEKYYLAVNPTNLDTKFIKNIKKLTICPTTINNSKYIKLLQTSISNKKHPLQNDGITKASSGTYLTTDLCPSSKVGYEDRLYKTIINRFKNPVPVTLFITSKWINKHKEQFTQLKQWQIEKKLDITWGNHTALHIYHPKVPLDKNFVLSPEENLTKDILSLELTLIKNGITPSIFFRFPGLVSNKRAIYRVKTLGLITIGSNSWLAKGQKLKDGSIILVHGNKNEPKGVDILLKLIENDYITKLNDIKDIK